MWVTTLWWRLYDDDNFKMLVAESATSMSVTNKTIYVGDNFEILPLKLSTEHCHQHTIVIIIIVANKMIMLITFSGCGSLC